MALGTPAPWWRQSLVNPWVFTPQEDQGTPRHSKFAGTAEPTVTPAQCWGHQCHPPQQGAEVLLLKILRVHTSFCEWGGRKTKLKEPPEPRWLTAVLGFNPWYPWISMNRTKQAAALLMSPDLQKCLKAWLCPGALPWAGGFWLSSGRDADHRQGCAARPWLSFTWFAALGEEKHSEINISGF